MRTQCTTEQQFIALYQRDCDDVSVFAATDKDLASGTDVAFSLELADGQPMLRGIGVVVSAWSTADNRFGRAGVHIAFTQLTTASEPILERLLDMRALADAQPRKRSNTQIRFGVAPSPSALASWPDEESVVGDVRRSITGEHTAVDASTGTPATFVEGPASNTARYDGPIRAPATAAPRARDPARPPLPNTMGLAPAVAILPNPGGASSEAAAPSTPTPLALGAAPIIPVAVATLPQDAPTQPRAPIVVPPEPDASRPLIARGSSPSTPGIANAASPADPTQFARASEPVMEPSVALPIPAPPASQIDLVPYPDDPDELTPPPSLAAGAYRWIADRLAPIGRGVRRASTWCLERARPAYRRSADVLEPRLRTLWHSRARTPLVFVAGLVVGLIVSGWLRSSPPTTVASATPPSPPSPSSLALAAPRCTPDSPAAVAMPAPPADVSAKPSPTKRATTAAKPATTATAAKPQVAMTRPATTTAKLAKPVPQVAMTRPATTAVKPATTAVKPATTAVKPATTAVKPATTAVKPATTVKPQVATTKPQVATTKPQVATTKPQVAATKPQVATAKPQVATAKPQVVTTGKPVTKTSPAPVRANAARSPAAKGTAKPAPKSATARCTSLDCI